MYVVRTCEERRFFRIYGSEAQAAQVQDDAMTQTMNSITVTVQLIVSWEKKSFRSGQPLLDDVDVDADADVRRQVAAYSGLPTQTALTTARSSCVTARTPFCLK